MGGDHWPSSKRGYQAIARLKALWCHEYCDVCFCFYKNETHFSRSAFHLYEYSIARFTRKIKSKKYVWYTSRMKAIIMAGGSGTRLWPVSRKNTPKQGQPFGDKETMLQKTFARLRHGWPTRDIFVSTSFSQYPLLRRQLPLVPKTQFFCEPAKRETAAAIGLVAAYMHKKNPRQIFFTANSDAYLKETDEYIRVLKTAEKAVTRYPSQTVLIGIKPRYAHTGLGYIKMKRQLGSIGKEEIFLVEKFVEKPDARTAARYVASWQYLWNPAMFVFRADALLEKFRRYLNPSYKLLQRIEAAIGTKKESATIKRLFPKMQKISIDYGILEKDRSMLVIPADLTWSDIGDWSAVFDMMSDHPQSNVVHGRHIVHDSHGNMIASYSGKLIAAAGVTNMIIIETEDAILVCPRHRAQDVKKLVTLMEQQAMHKYL